MPQLPELPWFLAEPERLERELEAMAEAAPDLTWDSNLGGGGGWQGQLPVWPFARPVPPGPNHVIADRRFVVEIRCREAHPAAMPRVVPSDPTPDLRKRGRHAWHLNPDGSLCLAQTASAWTGDEMTAVLIPKAVGWFLEYVLLEVGRIDAMTEVGIADSDEFDGLLADETLEGGTR